MHSKQPHSNSKGYILLTTLIMVAVLGSMLIAMTNAATGIKETAELHKSQQVAYYLARAGLARGCWRIENMQSIPKVAVIPERITIGWLVANAGLLFEENLGKGMLFIFQSMNQQTMFACGLSYPTNTKLSAVYVIKYDTETHKVDRGKM